MADQWDPASFGLSAPATSASATGSASSSASASAGAPAQSGGGAWDPAAFGLQAAPVAAASQSSDGGQNGSASASGTKTGYAANIAAAAVRGSASGLNMFSDPVGNLIGKPAGIVLGAAHDALAPVFGYNKWTNEDRAALFGDDTPQIGDRVVGAVQRAVEAPPLDTVQPGSFGERLVSAGVEGAVGMLGMGLAGAAEGAGARALVKTGAAAAGLGASGGVTGDLAATAAPDEYKPLASLVGNIVGAGIPTTAKNVAQSVIGKPLGDYAAPAIGLRNTLLDPAGAPITGVNGVPLRASANQVRLAGNDLQSITSDPAAVRETLVNPPPSPVPGVQLTTAQLTRDPGIGMQEYQASRAGTTAEQAAFKARQDQQNDARVSALQGVGDGADPAAVPTYLQQQAGEIRSAADARVTQAQTAAQAQIDQARTGVDQRTAGLQTQAGQALDAIGGNLPAGSDAQVGAALRAPMADRYQTVRGAERDLHDAIDPNGTLAVDMTPVRDRANQIANGIGPNAAPPAGEEASILGTAAKLPDVQSFRDLADLKSRVTGQIRDARMGGRDQEVRRLSMLLDGVHDAMAGAANSADLAPAAANAAPPATVAAPNVGSDVFTPSGQRVPVQYQVADASDLVTSHGADMQPNPAFPPELQPRDRDRAASGVQVARIAGQLQPERLGASSTVADGAPIVGPDGIVESGNGRVMAIRQAYDANGPQAAGYRDWLANQGHDTTGMQQPVLIRRRTGDMTPEQRQSFVSEANAPTTLAMSSTERAAGDAAKLSDDVLQHHQGGDVADPANRDFTRSFIRNIADPGQEGAMVTADGSLSQEGAGRMRAALVHKAYGDKGLSAALGETTDPTARVLAGAMQDAAGPMARLKAGIEGGRVDPAVDIAPALVEATQVVQGARQRGISLADAVAQRDAFNPVSARAEGLLKAAYGPTLAGRMSQERMTGFLTDYARQAQEQSASANLFGANLSADQLLEGASARYGKATGTEGAYASGHAGFAGQGVGAGRDQARGFVGGAGRQEAPSGSGGQQGSRVLEEPPLTANFDRAAADRYGEARQATVDRVATFKNAPGVGQALQQGPTAGSFKAPDSAIPRVIIRPGPQGASIAQAYLRAGGSTEELSNAAAYSLRQFAMRPDGTLDPAKYQAWSRDRAGFLSQIPDAASRFGAAADAQRTATDAAGSSALTLKQATATAQKTVDDAMTARATATKTLQNSILGKFLDGSDPVARVSSILRDKAMGRVQMAQLAKAVEGSPEAKAALQRAVGESITREIVGNTKGIDSESGAIKSDRFQTFLRSAEPALREALTPEQVDGLQRVGASLEQTNFVSQVGPGSQTAQLTAGRSATLMSRIGSEIAGYATGGSIGGAVGFAVAGVPGSYVGGVMGGAVSRAVQAVREAGIENVEQLKTQALLNPALFQLLLTKANRNSEPALMNRLATQFRRISLVGGVQASNEAEKEARKVQPVARATPLPPLRVTMPTNALAGPNDLAPVRRNSLFSGAGAP